jgi:hypothetical protein
MRKRMGLMSFVCALLMGVIPVVSAGSATAAEDSSEGRWDPARALEAAWTSVEASARLSNPAEMSRQGPDLVRRALTVSGEIRVMDLSHVIALSTVPAEQAIAMDSSGQSFRSAPAAAKRWYRPLQNVLQIDPNSDEVAYGLEPAYTTLQFNVDPNTRYPTGSISVTWDTPAVFADQFEAVAMPFVVSGRWVEIVPGVKARVDEAGSEGDRAWYTVSVEYDGRNPDDQGLPAYLLADVHLLEANGLPLHDMETTFQPASPAARRVTLSGSASASCPGWCGKGVTSIQYVFAILPFEAKVPLALTAIPVPGLSP